MAEKKKIKDDSVKNMMQKPKYVDQANRMKFKSIIILMCVAWRM